MNYSEEFHEDHREFWLEPENHALVKENDSGLVYYSIFTIDPKLMLLLCDDFDYAKRLANKMIATGVRIFDSVLELSEWSNQRNSTDTTS